MRTKTLNILLSLVLLTSIPWRFIPDDEVIRLDVEHDLVQASTLETDATTSPQPTFTAQVNLPFVQQLAPTATPTLSPFDEGYPAYIETLSATAFEHTTPTPTPIPPQGESTNFPIVAGAFVIISIVALSWVVFGRKINSGD